MSTRVGSGSAAPRSAYIATKRGITNANRTARMIASAISRKIGYASACATFLRKATRCLRYSWYRDSTLVKSPVFSPVRNAARYRRSNASGCREQASDSDTPLRTSSFTRARMCPSAGLSGRSDASARASGTVNPARASDMNSWLKSAKSSGRTRRHRSVCPHAGRAPAARAARGPRARPAARPPKRRRSRPSGSRRSRRAPRKRIKA